MALICIGETRQTINRSARYANRIIKTSIGVMTYPMTVLGTGQVLLIGDGHQASNHISADAEDVEK